MKMKNTDITWSASASGHCADDVYRLSAKREYNPNNLKASDYTEELAHSVQQAREKLMEMMLDLNEKYGTPKQKARMYVMKRFMTQEEKDDFINSIMNYNIIYDGDFHQAIRELHKQDNDGIRADMLYM